jgi:hypothetical protein
VLRGLTYGFDGARERRVAIEKDRRALDYSDGGHAWILVGEEREWQLFAQAVPAF